MYTIVVTLFDDDSNVYTKFEQVLEDSFNTEDFDNVIDKFNTLVEFVNANYDTEDTFDITAYVLDEDGEAIY